MRCSCAFQTQTAHRKVLSEIHSERSTQVRMLMQIAIPVDAGNQAARTGALGPTFQKLLESR
jgi:hypothetical protein